MNPGTKRTLAARLIATFGCTCGVVGFSQPSDPAMGMGGLGWFAGGALLLLLALFVLVDGAVSFEKSQLSTAHKH